MDEETTVQNETEELAAETLAAFDEGWEDSDEPVVPDDGQDIEETEYEEPETESEGEETEADADQQEAEGNEGGDAEAEESEGSGDKGSSDQGEFVLKHLGEQKAVSRDEVVALAQKGMDYDRIREKWDGVKDDIARLRMYESFLAELAEGRGGDIDSLIDETRIRTLMARAEAEGEELSPAAAAAIAVKMRTDYVPNGGTSPEEAKQERSQRETARFLEAYPDVQATDIPKEVWEAVNENGGDLLGAYRDWENRKLKEDIKALKKELGAEQQQKKNKARSTGSTKTTGSSSRRDAFDEGWDAAY